MLQCGALMCCSDEYHAGDSTELIQRAARIKYGGMSHISASVQVACKMAECNALCGMRQTGGLPRLWPMRLLRGLD